MDTPSFGTFDVDGKILACLAGGGVFVSSRRCTFSQCEETSTLRNLCGSWFWRLKRDDNPNKTV